MTSTRPENQLPPEYFYNDVEAKKYTDNTRIIEIQATLTERCIELLDTKDESLLILDVGCGSGLSGEILSSYDHTWVGFDISRDMLNLCKEKEVEGDVFQNDMGQGFKFRAGIFDAAISVSALQWLCVAGKKHDNPFQRLNKFFQSLYNSLKAGGRAVLQFYPDGNQQIDMITKAAMKAGFSGGLVVDYPNSSKAKKLYLVLDAGGSVNQQIIQIKGKTEEDDEISDEEEEENNVGVMDNKVSKKIRKHNVPSNKKPKAKSRQWVLNKKERMKKLGKDVKTDSKYSGRKRGLIRLLK